MSHTKKRLDLCLFARTLAFLGVLQGATLLAGCTMPYKSPCLRPSGAVFPGIKDAFKDSGGHVVPAIDVLLVHGMGTTDYQWVAERVGALAPALGFKWNNAAIPASSLPNGALLYQVTLDDGTRRVNISAVLWSPITAAVKKTLCYDVTAPTPSCADAAVLSKDTRASLNALLKNQLMDDRLSDVTFYLGSSGGALIREAVQDALLRSLSKNGVSLSQVEAGETPIPDETPVFVISESLGSKIVVDSLESMDANPKAKAFAQIERSHIDSLYLLANQIPILGLGETPDQSMRGAAGNGIRQFIQKRTARRQKDGFADVPLHIVAFSDPNDVFSYQLSQAMFPGDDVVVSNVVVSNDRTYAGVVENPVTAHTGYIARDVVIQAIAAGSPALPKRTAALCE